MIDSPMFLYRTQFARIHRFLPRLSPINVQCEIDSRSRSRIYGVIVRISRVMINFLQKKNTYKPERDLRADCVVAAANTGEFSPTFRCFFGFLDTIMLELEIPDFCVYTSKRNRRTKIWTNSWTKGMRETQSKAIYLWLVNYESFERSFIDNLRYFNTSISEVGPYLKPQA